MMSQVMVCARQAVCFWGGFHLKPTFAQVVEALESLGSGRKQSGVIFLSFFQFILTYLISGEKDLKCKCTYIIRLRCTNIFNGKSIALSDYQSTC